MNAQTNLLELPKNGKAKAVKEAPKLRPQADGQQLVSARELYDFLGLHPAVWARWCKKHITHNVYFQEGADYRVFNTNVENPSGRPTQDFAITIDVAKRLALCSNSSRREMIRDYFLKCERQLQQIKSTATEKLQQVLEEEAAAAQRRRRLLQRPRRKSVHPIYKFLSSEEVQELCVRLDCSRKMFNHYMRFRYNSYTARKARLYATLTANENAKRMMERVDEALRQLQLPATD